MKLIMLTHTELLERLSTVNRYKKLLVLRGDIKRSMNNMTVSNYAGLARKIEERIKIFEYPRCGAAKISIIFSNGLETRMDLSECLEAANSRVPISTYIFSKYRSAVDFIVEADDAENLELSNLDVRSEESMNNAPRVVLQSMAPPINFKEQIQDLYSRLNRIEVLLAEEIPVIKRSITDLNIKMDFLYRKTTAKGK